MNVEYVYKDRLYGSRVKEASIDANFLITGTTGMEGSFIIKLHIRIKKTEKGLLYSFLQIGEHRVNLLELFLGGRIKSPELLLTTGTPIAKDHKTPKAEIKV